MAILSSITERGFQNNKGFGPNFSYFVLKDKHDFLILNYLYTHLKKELMHFVRKFQSKRQSFNTNQTKIIVEIKSLPVIVHRQL